MNHVVLLGSLVLLAGLAMNLTPCVLPMIPVYSNVYFDFYTAHLQNYDVTESISWADEILGCVMDEIPAEEEEEPDEEVDGEVTIIE